MHTLFKIENASWQSARVKNWRRNEVIVILHWDLFTAEDLYIKAVQYFSKEDTKCLFEIILR